MLRKRDDLTKTEHLLCDLVEEFDGEDRSARERQMLKCKKLKLFWDNFQQVWYSEVAHDWRVAPADEDVDQAAYDKPVNIFRAYIESIIAALSVTVPPLECYPDDAENELDLMTAKAARRIADLIYRHNNVNLLWVHALFIYMTEGMVGCYNYAKEDEKLGTYKEDKYETRINQTEISTCPNCGYELDSAEPAMPEMEENGIPLPAQPGLEMTGLEEECPSCGQLVTPNKETEIYEYDELVGTTTKTKSRQCLEAYGGLYLKTSLSAKSQKDMLYVIFDREIHFAQARAEYPDIRDKIQCGSSGSDAYYRQMRENNQYVWGEADNTVTKRMVWMRPAAFQTLDKEKADHLTKKFPTGVKVVLINEELAEYEEEKLDDHWTFTHNPLSDYMQHDPPGLLLVSIQEITNDLISLILQTIEHGIPQTMADPGVLDFKKYKQTEAGPGMIFPATPKSGKSLGDAFYEVRTATLSAEVFPFSTLVQQFGQQVSGALPSLFGGQLEGSKTASEYSMSRSQALQRLQNVWKMITIWWKEIFAKVIPAHIALIKDDERFVEKDKIGNFVNIVIRRSELEGRLGAIELEANENLPLTWLQRKDTIIQLMGTNNPQVLEAIAAPENLPIMQDALGLSDFYMPGEDDRTKQYDEIKQLLESEPIFEPPSEEQMMMAYTQGMPPPEPMELPSVEVDDKIDDHMIQFEICRRWLVSEAGRLAKVERPAGYRNVMLHALQHQYFLQPPPMDTGSGANLPKANPLETQEAPITGEPSVQVS